MDYTFWLVLGLALIVLGSSWSADKHKNLRLKRIERKVDLILRHLGLDADQGVNQQVMELVKAGQKIEAIKLHRQQTGVGLKEAKDYVESL